MSNKKIQKLKIFSTQFEHLNTYFDLYENIPFYPSGISFKELNTKLNLINHDSIFISFVNKKIKKWVINNSLVIFDPLGGGFNLNYGNDSNPDIFIKDSDETKNLMVVLKLTKGDLYLILLNNPKAPIKVDSIEHILK